MESGTATGILGLNKEVMQRLGIVNMRNYNGR